MGIEFRHSAPIVGLGKHQWDLVVDNSKIVIEVDGCYWHSCPGCGLKGPVGTREKDAEHTVAAEAAGWTVIRITEHEVNRGDFSVLQTLKMAA